MWVGNSLHSAESKLWSTRLPNRRVRFGCMHIREVPFEVFLPAELVPALITLGCHFGGGPVSSFEAMSAKCVFGLERSTAIGTDLFCRHGGPQFALPPRQAGASLAGKDSSAASLILSSFSCG